jgi:hypothetical protein
MILVAVRDLLFRSKIQAAAERLGIAYRFAPRQGTDEEVLRQAAASTLLADLAERGALDLVRAFKRTGPARVVGFLGHLQQDLARDAAAAGVDEVLTRGQLVRKLDEILSAG